MNSLKEKTFKLSYKVTTPSGGIGNCSGILFNTEQNANNYLDLLVSKGETILECNIEDITETYKPRKSVVYATTRSWE